jgi:hypothetical protein
MKYGTCDTFMYVLMNVKKGTRLYTLVIMWLSKSWFPTPISTVCHKQTTSHPCLVAKLITDRVTTVC